MATLRELVDRHGLPLRVRGPQNNSSYPPFTIISETGQGEFRVRYDDGREGTVCECDWLSYYNVYDGTETTNTR